MPAGLEVTLPEPDTVSRSAAVLGAGVLVNVAVTFLASLTATVHGATPGQDIPAPLQAENTDPVPAVAVNVTLVPVEKVSVQSAPQAMPVGLEETNPFPTVLTERVYCTGGEGGVGAATNVAVTERAAAIVTEQVADVPQVTPEPDQPENDWPAAGVSVSTTTAPSA